MANDLTIIATAVGYAASPNAAFGQVLSAGNALTSGPIISKVPCTIEAWVTTTSTLTGRRVAAGQYLVGWIGVDGANACAAYGSANTIVNTNVPVNDGLRHHLRLVLDTTEMRLYVDGVLAASSTAAYSFDFVSRKFSVRGLNFAAASNNLTNLWASGDVDEVVVWDSAKSAANFTPPAAPTGNTSAGLVALYHFENNLLDSATPAAAATALTLAGPASGAVGVASTNFTVGANGNISGTVTVTPSDGGQGGTFTPATVALTVASPTATFTYTAASSGAKAISIANNGSLANPSGVTYTVTASDTTAPTFVSAQVANANPNIILVTMSEALAASVPPASAFTLSGGRTATAVSISGAVASVTASSAYAYGDAITISYTQPTTNPRLQDAAANSTANFTAQPVTNNIAAPVANNAYDTGKILFSPYNWDAQATRAKTINAGAYFRTIFGGPSCTLQFDVTASKAPFTQLMYRVDGTGPWITVSIAASVPIAVPADTSGYAMHYLEVRVKATAMSTTYSIWPAVSAAAVILTGVILDAGQTLTMPVTRPLRALVYGDSITVGYRSLNGGESTVSSDAAQTGAYVACEAMNAEFGIVAFSGHGWLDGGYGSVPGMDVTWDELWEGMPRSFSPAPDFILINQGTNDGSTNVTTTVTAIINGLLAATPATTKIILLRPYGGATAANIQAGIAASSSPGRCFYINTSGWFRSANSSDALHPYGVEHITRLAPLTVDAIRNSLAAAPVLTSRTVSIAFDTAKDTPAANLSGLSVAFHDENKPGLFSVARYKADGVTLDANGVLSFTAPSTLPVGGVGHVTVWGDSKIHFNGQVTVA